MMQICALQKRSVCFQASFVSVITLWGKCLPEGLVCARRVSLSVRSCLWVLRAKCVLTGEAVHADGILCMVGRISGMGSGTSALRQIWGL